MRPLMKILLLILPVLFPAAALSDAYKWYDEEGRVHYSDTPPKNIECEEIEIKQHDRADCDDKDSYAQRREKALMEAERRIEQRRKRIAEKASRDKSHRPITKQCLESREQLEVLKTRMPVYRDDKGKYRAAWRHDAYRGERSYLDDEERRREIQRTRKMIDEYCQYPEDDAEQKKARQRWKWSERCIFAKQEYERIQRPEMRATDQAIEKKRRAVELFCK
jgi:hypothetical protein